MDSIPVILYMNVNGKPFPKEFHFACVGIPIICSRGISKQACNCITLKWNSEPWTSTIINTIIILLKTIACMHAVFMGVVSIAMQSCGASKALLLGRYYSNDWFVHSSFFFACVQ